MRTLQLWLKKSDGRENEPEWFVKDVKDLNDPYQSSFFTHRTISENDKFVNGVFLEPQELEAKIRKAVEMARIGMIDDEYSKNPFYKKDDDEIVSAILGEGE